MTKETQKVESVKIKRFTVLENNTEVLNTSKKEEAETAIENLRKESKPVLKLLDNQLKTSLHYTKTINQKNYRIQAGNFEKDSIAKPASTTEVTE